jgi:hypothetical protein
LNWFDGVILCRQGKLKQQRHEHPDSKNPFSKISTKNLMPLSFDGLIVKNDF